MRICGSLAEDFVDNIIIPPQPNFLGDLVVHQSASTEFGFAFHIVMVAGRESIIITCGDL
jgi:hypothetical protein